MPRVSERVAPAQRYRATRVYPELQAEMRARGWSMQELAEAADVSRATLHMLSRGARSHHDTIDRIRSAIVTRGLISEDAPAADGEVSADSNQIQEADPCSQTV